MFPVANVHSLHEKYVSINYAVNIYYLLSFLFTSFFYFSVVVIPLLTTLLISAFDDVVAVRCCRNANFL